MRALPSFQCLQRGLVVQGFLRQRLIVQPDVAVQRLLQVLGAVLRCSNSLLGGTTYGLKRLGVRGWLWCLSASVCASVRQANDLISADQTDSGRHQQRVNDHRGVRPLGLHHVLDNVSKRGASRR